MKRCEQADQLTRIKHAAIDRARAVFDRAVIAASKAWHESMATISEGKEASRHLETAQRIDAIQRRATPADYDDEGVGLAWRTLSARSTPKEETNKP